MLLQMRTFTRSIFAYALLFVLIGAFAIWGIHDVFNAVGKQNLAEVGGRSVTPLELDRELELRLKAQRRQGNNMSQEDAIRQGLHLRVLDSLITQAALGAYADKIHVAASDALVAKRIREIPAVQNPVTGNFDEGQYAQFLQQLGYSQPEFVDVVRSDLTTQLILEPLTAGLRPPSSYGAMAVAFQSESRTVSIAEAPATLVGAVPQPTEAQLRAFYQENQSALQMPEFRALTLVYARAADFAGRVNIPEDRLRQEFEARRAQMTQPEKRTYVRVTARTQQQADDVANRIAHGASPEAAAQAVGLQAQRGENEAQTEVSDANVAAAVFAMPVNAPARVVRGALAPFVVVKVEGVTPAVAPTFESQRDAIRTELAGDEATELMNAAVSSFEDARAGGAAIADAARAAHLVVVNIPVVESHGRDRDGRPVDALTGHAELLSTAFATQEGEASDFIPVDDADVIVAVDHITPAAARPFDEVRAQLAEAWRARERVRRMQELSQQIEQAATSGQSFATIVAQRHLRIAVRSQPINRQAAAQLPARRLAAEIFNANEGAIVTDVAPDGSAMLVAVVEHVQRLDPAQARPQIEAARASAADPMREGLVEALTGEITAQGHPRRNQALIDQRYHANAAGEDDQAQQ